MNQVRDPPNIKEIVLATMHTRHGSFARRLTGIVPDLVDRLCEGVVFDGDPQHLIDELDLRFSRLEDLFWRAAKEFR
jgi:hypothetical protein